MTYSMVIETTLRFFVDGSSPKLTPVEVAEIAALAAKVNAEIHYADAYKVNASYCDGAYQYA